MAPLPQDRPRPVLRPRPAPAPDEPGPRAGRPRPPRRRDTAILLAVSTAASVIHPVASAIGTLAVGVRTIAGPDPGRARSPRGRSDGRPKAREGRFTKARAATVLALLVLWTPLAVVSAIPSASPLQDRLYWGALFLAVDLALVGLGPLTGRLADARRSRVPAAGGPPAGRHVHDHLLPYDFGIVSGMWNPDTDPEAERYLRLQRTVDRIAAAVEELEPCSDLDDILADARQTQWETARDLYRIRGFRTENQKLLDEHGPPPPPVRRTRIGAMIHRMTSKDVSRTADAAAAGLRSAARALDVVDTRIDALGDAAARVEEPLVRRAEHRQLLDIADRHDHYVELALTSESTALPASSLNLDRLGAEAAFAVRVRLAREALARARELTADTGLDGAGDATGEDGRPQAAEDP